MKTSVILAGKCDSHGHSATSFSEDVVLADTSYKVLLGFIILQLEDGLTSFNQDNSANFFGEKDVQ